MSNHISIKIEHEAGDEDMLITVADDYGKAEPFSLPYIEDHDPMAVAILCMDINSDVSDILRNAIDFHRVIDTTWGYIEAKDIPHEIKAASARDEAKQLEQDTAEAAGVSKSGLPRL